MIQNHVCLRLFVKELRFRAKFLTKVIILYGCLKVIVQKAHVFSSGEACGTRRTSKRCPKPCVFKTFREKVGIPYEVFVKSVNFVRVFECHFSKSTCFFIGGTPRNRMHQKKWSKTMCFLDFALKSNDFVRSFCQKW